MNGTSGFQEMRSSTSRSSTNRFLHEQRDRFGTGACHLLCTHDFIARSTDIILSRENASDIIFMLPLMSCGLAANESW